MKRIIDDLGYLMYDKTKGVNHKKLILVQNYYDYDYNYYSNNNQKKQNLSVWNEYCTDKIVDLASDDYSLIWLPTFKIVHQPESGFVRCAKK